MNNTPKGSDRKQADDQTNNLPPSTLAAIKALQEAAATLNGDAGFFGPAGDARHDAHIALAERCKMAAAGLKT